MWMKKNPIKIQVLKQNDQCSIQICELVVFVVKYNTMFTCTHINVNIILKFGRLNRFVWPLERMMWWFVCIINVNNIILISRKLHNNARNITVNLSLNKRKRKDSTNLCILYDINTSLNIFISIFKI